jgi:hypothetical protein
MASDSVHCTPQMTLELEDALIREQEEARQPRRWRQQNVYIYIYTHTQVQCIYTIYYVYNIHYLFYVHIYYIYNKYI